MMPSKNFKISDDYEEKFSFQKKIKLKFLYLKSKREKIVWKAKLFQSDNFGGIIRNNNYVIPKCSFLFQFAF